jgi:hypothetical protein
MEQGLVAAQWRHGKSCTCLAAIALFSSVFPLINEERLRYESRPRAVSFLPAARAEQLPAGWRHRDAVHSRMRWPGAALRSAAVRSPTIAARMRCELSGSSPHIGQQTFQRHLASVVSDAYSHQTSRLPARAQAVRERQLSGDFLLAVRHDQMPSLVLPRSRPRRSAQSSRWQKLPERKPPRQRFRLQSKQAPLRRGSLPSAQQEDRDEKSQAACCSG